MGLITTKSEGAAPATPPSGYVTLYTDGSVWKYKTDAGSVFTLSTGVTAEEVQDIVGAFFADSSSIDVTYNDAGDVISATVIASGVNHNALQNYVANQHVDHSTVSVSAGTGLTGGGDLTATRTLSLANVGTAGTYRSVTTNAQGQVTAGTNPTTLAGYGITDAQPLDGDLTAVAALSGTGLVARTAANTMAVRTVTAGAGIGVTNGDGVSGNPTIANTDGGAAAVSTHVGLSDPHTQYELEANLAADVRAVPLTGFTAGAGTVAATDTVLQAFQKLQGTITAGVASFGNDVRGTVLTGFSATPDAVVAATDTLLAALGKLQAQIDRLTATDDKWIELIKAADTIVNSAVTFTSITNLGFTAVAGRTYYMEYTLLFRTAATTTGFAVTMATSDTAVVEGSLIVNMPIAADGTAAGYTGNISAFGDVVVSTGVQTVQPTWNICNMKGVFRCTTGGTIVPQFRSEVSLSNVNCGAGSVALIREFA